MAKAKLIGPSGGLGGLTPKVPSSARCPNEAKLLRAMEELRSKLRPMTDPERAMHVATRQAADLLGADACCFAVIAPGEARASVLTSTGNAGAWDAQMLGAFAQGERRDPPEQVALARVKRRSRPWGVVALRWEHAAPSWEVRGALVEYIKAANDALGEIERSRLLDVRARIDRKIMEQLRARDLFYQILDGLRSLTGFDHSATVLIGERGQPTLEIAAEKLAWRHGKSQRVGASLDVPQDQVQALLAGGVTGCTRSGDGLALWRDHGPAPPWLQHLLNARCTGSPNEPAIGEALIAPLATRDGLRAVLVISCVHPGRLGQYEAELVASFLPQVSISLQNSRWAEAMEKEMLATERKHAMADLARGVAHDVNNALGATIPLLQQVRSEVAGGRIDQQTLGMDLEQIERSVRVCRDIFGGMLRFARTAARPAATASLRAACEICLMILRDSLRRRNVRVDVAVPAELPDLALNQSELEQLLLNLMTNARDAMGAAGTPSGELFIGASLEGARVQIEVRDTGCGIAPEHLPHVQEPFFTTKPHGSGLGLSICRAIVWRSQGELKILSGPGEGTCVLLDLPAAADAPTPALNEPVQSSADVGEHG